MKDRFNTIWGAIFTGLFVLIMLPLPCFANESYIPGPFGVPNYIYGWLAVGVTTVILILIWTRMALKRPEYHEFDEKEDK